jgi:hypothetical protein
MGSVVASAGKQDFSSLWAFATRSKWPDHDPQSAIRFVFRFSLRFDGTSKWTGTV